TQSHRKKLIGVRHRILTDFFGVTEDFTKSERGNPVRIAKQIWSERKEEILRSVHNDASEEISRIGMHLERMLEIFKNGESAGRELEFFLQELTRETNTIGAKAQDAEINSLTVLMKTEIEKLREQVRNLE